MLNIRKSFIFLAAILSFAAVSCQLDDTLYYNNLTMGNIVDGKFLSDQGNIFNIVEQQCSGNIAKEKRAIVICDVLNETEGATKEYEVRLRQFASVLEKNAILAAEATEEELLAAKVMEQNGGEGMGEYTIPVTIATIFFSINLIRYISKLLKLIIKLIKKSKSLAKSIRKRKRKQKR